jgi:hypothetical protein
VTKKSGGKMVEGNNNRLFLQRHLSHTITAALFSMILIFGTSVVSLSFQQPHKEANASPQLQGVPPPQISPSTACDPIKSEQVYPVRVYQKWPWAFIYTVYKGQGLVLKTLLANSNDLLDSISVPHFKIEYGGKSKIIRFCNEMNSEPKITPETTRYGVKYDRLTWGFTKVFNEPDLQGTLNINYNIIIKTSRSLCEKGAEAECYRFVPTVSFSWKPPPFPSSCSVEQLQNCPITRTIPEKLTKFTAFYKLDYGKTSGMTLTSDYNNLPAAILLNLGPQLIQQLETRFRAVTDGGEGTYDNVHNTHMNQGVSIPACRETKFDCLHMHWRWTDARDPRQRVPLDPLVDTITDLQLPKQLSGTAYFTPGQTIDIAILKDHSDKAYEAFPNDPLRLVDREPIASASSPKAPPYNGGPFVLNASFHPVMWYIASVKNTNEAEFFRHGMFVLDTS